MARQRKPPKMSSVRCSVDYEGNSMHSTQPDENSKEAPEGIPEESIESSPYKLWFILSLALLCGALNAANGYALFENDRYFSHLSELEREMTFRTEMGLYYSYYKTIVVAPNFFQGLQSLISNNVTEYPTTINTLKRFNLYPEIVLGLAYRIFDTLAAFLGVDAKNCWMIDRKDLPSVESCGGLGDAAIFYVTSIYVWNALTGIAIVLIAFLVSDSTLGAILSSIIYFCNYSEATRIQWSPPLRESFGYPCLILQISQTTWLLSRKINAVSCILYVITTTCCLLFWQFSQFALLTEMCALFAVFAVHSLINWRQMQYFGAMHLVSLFIAYNLLFMNDMLFTSMYMAAVMSILIVSKIRVLNISKRSLLKTFVQLGLFALFAMAIKCFLGMILRVEDDSHIWNILRAKLSNYKDFHSMLYMCAPEFDFLKFDYLKSLWPTLLVPLGVALIALAKYAFQLQKQQCKQFPLEIVYNIYQCLAFSIMAFMIMRLKMFLTPHLCILASLSVSRRLISWNLVRWALFTCLLAILMTQGVQKLHQEHSHQGEYSNPQFEELLNFIKNSSQPTDSFAGPMPLMANILLSTGRPVINHPHYEDAGLRAKTIRIYTLLSRKSLREVHGHLRQLQTKYVVLSRSWCFGKMRTGCALVDIWDELDEVNRLKPQVCDRLLRKDTENLFKPVFYNGEYMMLGLN